MEDSQGEEPQEEENVQQDFRQKKSLRGYEDRPQDDRGGPANLTDRSLDELNREIIDYQRDPARQQKFRDAIDEEDQIPVAEEEEEKEPKKKACCTIF